MSTPTRFVLFFFTTLSSTNAQLASCKAAQPSFTRLMVRYTHQYTLIHSSWHCTERLNMPTENSMCWTSERRESTTTTKFPNYYIISAQIVFQKHPNYQNHTNHFPALFLQHLSVPWPNCSPISTKIKKLLSFKHRSYHDMVSDHSCFAYMFYWDMYAHN